MHLAREDARTRERYGDTHWGKSLLTARRLVEAGVRVVTIGYGRWDYHGANFVQLRAM